MKTTNIFYRALCFVLMALCSVMAGGQTEYTTVPQVIPPSPTVRGLCKYGEIPVDYSTGIPDITIPLYTLKCGSLELPITLSYHAGGIRVDEAASWVGLGWSLKAGGTIGVTTNGKRDMFQFPYELPSFEEMRDDTFDGYSYLELDDWYYTRDLHPDIFTYSLGNITGQFMYDLKDKKFYNVNGQKNVTVEKIGEASDYYFQLYDNKGNLYVLDEQERAESSSNISNATIGVYTAWNMSKLLSASLQDSITVTHSPLTIERDKAQYVPSRTFGLNEQEEWKGEYVTVQPSGITLGSRDLVNQVTTTYYTNKPTSIKGSNGLEIIFETESGRLDMPSLNNSENPSYLKRIIVKDASGNQLNKWEFLYDYFHSYIENPREPSTAYRLKLKGLKEFGTDNTVCNTYSFAYYGEDPGEPQMPYRYSFAGKDAWGFCNGQPSLAASCDSLKAFPNFENVYFNMYRSTEYYVRYNKHLMVSNTTGESKSANGDYTHAYSLKRITYPTGGYSEFVYEQNHFTCVDNFRNRLEWVSEQITANGAGIRIKEIINHDGKKANKRIFTYSEGEIMAVPHYIQRKVYQTNASIPEVPFELQGLYNNEIRTYMEMYSSPYNNISLSNGGCVGYTQVIEQFSEGKNVYEYSPLNKGEGDEYAQNEEFALYHSYLMVSACSDSPVDYVHDGVIFYANELGTEHTDDRYNSYTGLYGTFFNRGLLLSKSTYDQSDRLVYKEVNEYDYSDIHRIIGADIYQSPTLVEFREIVNYELQRHETYFYSFYWHMTGLSQLTKKVATEYTYDGNIQKTHVTTTHYTYNVDNLPASTRTVDSCGDSIVVNTLYPSDITSSSVCQSMVERNMLDYPIETIKKHNGNTVSAGLTIYGEFDGGYYPSAYYTYRPSAPDAAFTPFNGSVQSEYGTPDAVITHYEHGRIASMKGKDNVVNNYLWGYHWEYPIAEIRGIPYSGITSALTPSAYGSMSTVPTSTLTSLRSLFTTAQVSCYSYLPGIGMQYMQGADKRVRKFGYDGLGRFSELYRGEDFSNVRLTEKHTYHTINE